MNATNIFDACRRGDREEVEQLWQVDAACIKARDSKGFTPLILSVYNHHLHLVEFLLEKGADPDSPDDSGNTALMGACFKGYEAIAKRLLQAGAAINQTNGNEVTALSFAATFGQLSIAEMLLQKGADASLKDVRGKSPLDHAWIQQNADMLELIQRHIKNEKNDG